MSDARSWKFAAFKWDMPGGSGTTAAMKSWVENAGPLQRVAPDAGAEPVEPGAAAPQDEALARVAEAAGTDAAGATELATYEGTTVWLSQDGDDVYLFTTGSGPESGARTTVDQLSSAGLTLSSSSPSGTEQFVYVDPSVEADVQAEAELSGLENLGGGLFVDTAIEERSDLSVVSVGASEYQVYLSGATED